MYVYIFICIHMYTYLYIFLHKKFLSGGRLLQAPSYIFKVHQIIREINYKNNFVLFMYVAFEKFLHDLYFIY